MTAKRRWFAFALVALMVGVAARSHAQDYPSRFIRVIVGPGPDITARVFGAKITEVLGQQVVVEPRPGAGGTIAAQAVAGAPGDGYTLLLASASYTINTAMGQSPLDLGRDFAPIVVDRSVRAGGASALAAKASPSSSRWQPTRQAQLCVVGHRYAAAPCRRAVQIMAGIDVVHVPFRGERTRRSTPLWASRSDDVLDRLDRSRADEQGYGTRHRRMHVALAHRLVPGLSPSIAQSGLAGFSVIGWNLRRAQREHRRRSPEAQCLQRGTRRSELRQRLVSAGTSRRPREFFRRVRNIPSSRHGEMDRPGGKTNMKGH